MDERIWDIANLVAGFAIAQNIALAYAVATNDARIYFRENAKARMMVYVGSVVTLLVYLYAIWKCCYWAYPLDKDLLSKSVWIETSIWRSVGILYFALLPPLVVKYSDRLGFH